MTLNINSAFSLLGQRNINTSFGRLAENLAKLSSGQSINKAADNAAGLAISEQLMADIRSAAQAERNILDGTSLTRTAEGGLSEVSDLLSRGRELSIQAANGTLNDEQRATLQNEISSIKEEVDRITGVTEFNGQKLLNGELAPGASEQFTVQAGVQNSPADQLSLNVIESTDTASLGISGVDISTQQGAVDALTSFDQALSSVNQTRGEIGSLQNRFESAAQNLGVFRENLSAANSQIRGLDYAEEASAFSRNQIQSQAAINTLGQSNTAQQSIIGTLLNLRG